MADFLGITYRPSTTLTQLQRSFTGGLGQVQQQDRMSSTAAWKGFESSLTPEQHAAQQKWQIEKMEGAPSSQWKADQQSFLATLTPQELSQRSNAINLQKTFISDLTPAQQDSHKAIVNLRDKAILQSIGGTVGSQLNTNA